MPMQIFILCEFFSSNRCIRFCIIIQQRYSDIKAGHPVVMATTSIAPAAKFLSVFLRKRSSGKNLHIEKGQSEAELTAEPRATSERPTDTPTTPRAPGRPNKLTRFLVLRWTCLPFIFYPCLETETERDSSEPDEGEDVPSGRMRNELNPREKKTGIDRMRWFGGSQGNVSDSGMRRENAADRTVCSSSHPSARS